MSGFFRKGPEEQNPGNGACTGQVQQYRQEDRGTGMKTGRTLAALAAAIVMIPWAAGATAYETYLAEGTIPSLKAAYEGKTDIGIPAKEVTEADPPGAERIADQCSLLILGEEVRGKNLLDRAGSKKKKDPEHARLKTGSTTGALDFAAAHDLKVRAATMIQPDNIPEWFFNEDWTDSSRAARVDRETMILRMENAIRDQIEQMNGKNPRLIKAWEVVRGGGQEGDLFRETIGADYVSLAFRIAREAAEEGQALLWALGSLPDEETMQTMEELHREGYLDGAVIPCSLTGAEQELTALADTMRRISAEGMEIHLSGVEIADTDRTAAGQIRLASRYRALFSLAEEEQVKSISLPALQDEPDREKGTPPRLINAKGKLTPAFFGALQDDAIPTALSEESVRAAVERLDLETIIKKEADPVTVYKKAENHNPVMVQRFGADPWAMVWNDRVYLYMTGDEPVYKPGEKPKTNDYSNIVTLRVLSSDDLVNWTDHGSVRAAGSGGAARWASNSWAPCAAWKNIDGEDRFFLYFANSGGGIGVLTSDSPTGPFTDPIGKALVDRHTPTCAAVTWLFDPAVLTDADGNAYLYFGGGIPEGRQADPGTARVVKLGADMISLDGDPVTISPPWLFEDSGINRFGDTYVYSYCTNFNVPAAGSPQGFSSGEIVYMTSDSPMGPFTYAGQVLKNPSVFFGVGGNNHHCMFCFRNQWYITYHAATLDKAMGWNAGYRSTFVDRLELNEEGLPAPSRGTTAGVPQLKMLDPYMTVPGATAVTMAGATTTLAYETDQKAGTGQMAVLSTTPDGWTAVAGVDFGETGAGSVRLTVRSEVPGKIEILTDSDRGETAAAIEVPACGEDTDVTASFDQPLTGIHDLYFRFTESGTELLSWQFFH